MRIAIALLAFFLSFAPAFAQDDAAERQALAMEFVKLTTAGSVMTPMIDAVWPGIAAQLPPSVSSDEAVVTRLKATFASEISTALEDVLDDLAALYADAFTTDELQTIVTFYGSPTGMKLVNNQGALLQQMLPTITARLQETLPQAMQKVLEEAQSGT